MTPSANSIPKKLIRNPVMFTTAVVATLLTVLLVVGQDSLATGFKLQLVIWLWLTVLFGTFAEALAEGRGKAQAASLRATKAELTAKKLKGEGKAYESVPASALRVGDIVLVETGRPDPVGRRSRRRRRVGERSGDHRRKRAGDPRGWRRPLGGHCGHARHLRRDPRPSDGGSGTGLPRPDDRACRGRRAAEDAERNRADPLLVGLTIIFLIAVGTIPSFASYAGGSIPVAILAALLITLIPTTIAALLSAIGIAGMDRLVRFNVLAKSGRAVEAAGDVDVLLLDKTGTITVGDRQATEFRPVGGSR